MTRNARKIKGYVRSAEMEEELMLMGDEARPKGIAGIWYDPSSPYFSTFIYETYFDCEHAKPGMSGDASWCQVQKTASILISSSISNLEF